MLFAATSALISGCVCVCVVCVCVCIAGDHDGAVEHLLLHVHLHQADWPYQRFSEPCANAERVGADGGLAGKRDLPRN